jgi:hypothetical protein
MDDERLFHVLQRVAPTALIDGQALEHHRVRNGIEAVLQSGVPKHEARSLNACATDLQRRPEPVRIRPPPPRGCVHVRLERVVQDPPVADTWRIDRLRAAFHVADDGVEDFLGVIHSGAFGYLGSGELRQGSGGRTSGLDNFGWAHKQLRHRLG